MKSFLYFFLLLLSFELTICGATIYGKATKVIDGDTFWLEDVDGGKFKVRLARIDAPEKTQEFGQDAKVKLEHLVSNSQVVVKFTTIDLYGRIVGDVYVANINVNDFLVSEGAAWCYHDYNTSTRTLILERIAKFLRIGLWKNDNPINPAVFRKNKKALD